MVGEMPHPEYIPTSLTADIHSENCIARPFDHCADIWMSYTNLDRPGCHLPWVRVRVAVTMRYVTFALSSDIMTSFKTAFSSTGRDTS